MLEQSSTLLPTCKFVVWGRAVPRGSTKAIVSKSTGRPIIIDQSSRTLKSWMQEIKQTAILEWGVIRNKYTEGPVAIDIVFRLDRPKSHYRTGRNSDILRDAAPRYPIVQPDIDKLTRAVLDALTTVVYKDDSQVVRIDVSKKYGAPEGCQIKVYEL